MTKKKIKRKEEGVAVGRALGVFAVTVGRANIVKTNLNSVVLARRSSVAHFEYAQTL